MDACRCAGADLDRCIDPVRRRPGARARDARASSTASTGRSALLLSLIEARRLDVLTVPLGALAGAYLEALASLPGDRLVHVSAFVAVASQLILIKSRALLPRRCGGGRARAGRRGRPRGGAARTPAAVPGAPRRGAATGGVRGRARHVPARAGDRGGSRACGSAARAAAADGSRCASRCAGAGWRASCRRRRRRPRSWRAPSRSRSGWP